MSLTNCNKVESSKEPWISMKPLRLQRSSCGANTDSKIQADPKRFTKLFQTELPRFIQLSLNPVSTLQGEILVGSSPKQQESSVFSLLF